MNNKFLVLVSVVFALVFFYVGYVYVTHTAGALPSFYPGHLEGATTVHIKHGIAAFVLGAGCLVFAWFQTGPKANS